MAESKKTNTEKETDITEPLKKGAQEAKEVAAETVEAVKKTTKRAGQRAKKVATSAKKTVEEKSEAAKEVAVETVEAVKKTAKETAANVKKTAKKEYTKAALKETYIQVEGHEYRETEILAKVEQAYVDAGNRLTSMKSLQLYIKPEDHAAYYVINTDITGKVEL